MARSIIHESCFAVDRPPSQSKRGCVKLLRMKTTEILSLIDTEIATLKQARALLSGTVAESEKKKPGRPKSTPAPAASAKKKKRNLSPEGRARIAEAVKRRWAAQKKAAK